MYLSKLPKSSANYLPNFMELFWQLQFLSLRFADGDTTNVHRITLLTRHSPVRNTPLPLFMLRVQSFPGRKIRSATMPMFSVLSAMHMHVGALARGVCDCQCRALLLGRKQLLHSLFKTRLSFPVVGQWSMQCSRHRIL